MGRRLADEFSDAMLLWKHAEKASGLPLRAVYWDSEDDALMADTRHLQPAVTVVNLGLWLHAAPRLAPHCAAGHSLGEFSALTAAGVLAPEKVIELVSLRGRLMAEADPGAVGAMCAISRLGLEEVENLAKSVSERTGKLVRVANRNTPSQFAVSGHRDAVETLAEEARSLKARAIPLAVSGAFHTSLMTEAAAEFSKILDRQDWRAARFPVYCNVNGEAVTEAGKIHAAVRRQMISPVCWIDVISNQWKDGIRQWLELGPQGVLTRMVRPILSACNAPDTAYSAGHISYPDTV
jgi:[acyl-carrier-protein] S-malonyltransferase